MTGIARACLPAANGSLRRNAFEAVQPSEPRPCQAIEQTRAERAATSSMATRVTTRSPAAPALTAPIVGRTTIGRLTSTLPRAIPGSTFLSWPADFRNALGSYPGAFIFWLRKSPHTAVIRGSEPSCSLEAAEIAAEIAAEVTPTFLATAEITSRFF